MGAAGDISNGIAAILTGAGIGVLNPSGVSQPADTAIVMKNVPVSPDRLVTITVVPLTDDVAVTQGQVMVQLRFRGVPNVPLDVDDLGDSVFPLFHGLRSTQMGSVYVVQCLRQQSVPLGHDAAKRWERADQFYLDVEYPPNSHIPY
jgi:hypothetical protein